MNRLDTLLEQIKTRPESIEFKDVIDTINDTYHYIPSRFTNGTAIDNIINQPGENEASCKIFSFANIHQLDEHQTLHCFGKYYREDVLQQPDNDDHANIRAFIRHGWENINFEGQALTKI
ncbi:MAG: HopJ type III effector protein [Gammaproteobacteria bacterium]|nr:HopJ type III effector protein [Gammaproteobacteria bacterium]